MAAMLGFASMAAPEDIFLGAHQKFKEYMARATSGPNLVLLEESEPNCPNNPLTNQTISIMACLVI